MRLNSIEYAITPAQVTDALEAKITDLAALYNETLKRVDSQPIQKAKLARQAIGLLIRTKRALLVEELRHALGIELCGGEFSWSRAPNIEIVLSACQGLVTKGRQDDHLRLVHYTLLEFLE